MSENFIMEAMLPDYSSLWEVYTAFFCSMLLSDILGGIWTPEYKRTVVGLIGNMGIPFVKTLANKLSSQIDANVKEISGHMHRRAIFMILFCVCLLGFTGAVGNMGFSDDSEKEILFWAVTVGLVIVLAGSLTFSNYVVTVVICILYGISFLLLCHCGHDMAITCPLLEDEKYAIGYLLIFMSLPITWQIISCWIYSSLYYGKLRDDLHKEEQLYKMAIIGIRTKNIGIVPDKYKVRAVVDINCQSNSKEDISYESCDDILYSSVDALLENPAPISILFSWLKHHIQNLFARREVDDSQFVNAQFEAFKQVEIPVSGLSHQKDSPLCGDSLSDRFPDTPQAVLPLKKWAKDAGKYGAILLGICTVAIGLLKGIRKNNQ